MRNLILFSCLFLIPGWICGQSYRCEDCARTASVDNCNFNDPMGILAPAAYCPSVKGHLAELMTTDCFHFLADPSYSKSLRDDGLLPKYGSKARIPEYSFDADFISGILEHDFEGYPVRSKLTITMYFNGDTRELVHSWQTQGTQEKEPVSLNEPNHGTDWFGHCNKLEHEYKNGPGIDEIIRRFEKRPADCSIEPEKDEVDLGETIEIKITDITDASGQNSREFNRIVVHAEHGKIKNGKECEAGPEYKVFKVEKGTITVQYQAPDICKSGSETITVYNSCEILPENKVPLSATKQKDKIAEKRIPINCSDAVLTITKTQRKEITTSIAEKKQISGCTADIKESHDLNDVTEATVKISLKAEIVNDMPVLTNQRWISYVPVKAEITKFNLSYNEKEYKYRNNYGGECDSSRGYEGNLTMIRKIINQPVIMGVVGPSFTVVFDAKTNKAIKLNPGACAIDFGFSHTENMQARKWPDNDPKLSYNREWKMDHYIFNLNPVEDQVSDPYGKLNPSGIREYMKGKVSEEVLANIPDLPIDEKSKNSVKIHPDQIVKTGDGTKSFGGEGRKVTEKQVKGGTEREELTFKWDMKLIEK
jgi:hypothetical protein